MNHPRNSLVQHHQAGAAVLLASIALAACANATRTAVFPTQAITSATSIATSTALPTSSPEPSPTSTTAPLNMQPQVVVLATDLPEPDDLLLAPDGSILISDVGDGTIKQYSRDGQVRLLLSGLNEPEGMVLLPDGSLIIAEQGTNRLLRYDFGTKALTPFFDLVNHTGNLGVDNIAWNGTNIIVPDSPNGTVLEVSPDGQMVRQLASGLSRPTAAWVEADGNILIADENGNAVLRLHTDGTLKKVGDYSVPDDVIADASGNIFVITLGDGAVHVIPAGQSQDVVLVSGLSQPQGMVFDADGNLVVTDPGHHRLVKVVIR